MWRKLKTLLLVVGGVLVGLLILLKGKPIITRKEYREDEEKLIRNKILAEEAKRETEALKREREEVREEIKRERERIETLDLREIDDEFKALGF